MQRDHRKLMLKKTTKAMTACTINLYFYNTFLPDPCVLHPAVSFSRRENIKCCIVDLAENFSNRTRYWFLKLVFSRESFKLNIRSNKKHIPSNINTLCATIQKQILIYIYFHFIIILDSTSKRVVLWFI